MKFKLYQIVDLFTYPAHDLNKSKEPVKMKGKEKSPDQR